MSTPGLSARRDITLAIYRHVTEGAEDTAYYGVRVATDESLRVQVAEEVVYDLIKRLPP